MSRRLGRRSRVAAGWLAVVVLIELCTRALVYALAPSVPERLSGELGGPSVVLVTLVALGLATLLSSAVVWLASLGARERWTLDGHLPGEPPPRVPLRLLLLRSSGLWLASTLVFGLVENYIHYRAGMGIHGLACLLGPVHRNAIPVTGALSLLAAASVSAAALLLSWMRRRIASVFGVRPRPARRALPAWSPVARSAPARVLVGRARPRGPPLVVV
jgi:hypothetical protein